MVKPIPYSHMTHRDQIELTGDKWKMGIKATMTATPAFERPCIEEGVYTCECVDIKEISEGKFGERLAIVCLIEQKNVQLSKIVYKKLTTASAATKVLEAFGIAFEDGKEFDFDNIKGKRARAWVENYDAVVDEKSQKVSGISKFKPIEEEVVKA